MLSIVKIFTKKIHSPLKIKDFEEISLSLLELMRFCKQILIQNFERKNSLSPVDSSLNFSSNSREKSYFVFGLNLTSGVLQKGKVFQKYSPVLLSNVLTDRINPTLASICLQ